MSAPEEFCLSRAIQMFALLLLLLLLLLLPPYDFLFYPVLSCPVLSCPVLFSRELAQVEPLN